MLRIMLLCGMLKGHKIMLPIKCPISTIWVVYNQQVGLPKQTSEPDMASTS